MPIENEVIEEQDENDEEEQRKTQTELFKKRNQLGSPQLSQPSPKLTVQTAPEQQE